MSKYNQAYQNFLLLKYNQGLNIDNYEYIKTLLLKKYWEDIINIKQSFPII